MATKFLVAALVSGSLLLGAMPAAAVHQSHLKCYRGRYTLATRGRFSGVTLTGQEVEAGCIVFTPAKMCCDKVSATGIPPQPGGGGPTTATSRFCCYRVHCPDNGPGPSLSETDEFGSRNFNGTRPRYLCSPATP